MGVGGFAFAKIQARKPGPLHTDKAVTIVGEDAIPDQLVRAGVIESTIWFNLTLFLDGNRSKLKRGEFLFKQHASLLEVEDVLLANKTLLHDVTVPEGHTGKELMHRVNAFFGDIEDIPRKGVALLGDFDQHLMNQARWGQTKKDANDQFAPETVSLGQAAPSKVRSALDPLDLRALGRLGPITVPARTTGASPLLRRLAKLGRDQLMREALFGPKGSLSASVTGTSTNLADTGVVVQGVNDQQTAEAAADDAITVPRGPVQSYLMSAAALAKQQSGAERSGSLTGQTSGVGIRASGASAASAKGALQSLGERPRAFDASEGTPLDPLLNRTYDLNYPKVVPVLK